MTGFLCIAPTDLTAAFPHGGTALGEVMDAEFRWGFRTSDITAEEYGGQVVGKTYSGESAVFACLLRGFDDDALSTIFPYTAVGTVGHRVVKQDVVTNVTRPGAMLATRAVKLCFSPRAVDQHRFIVLHRAIPLPDASARLSMRLDDEIGIGVVFQALPGSDGRVYEIGLRKDVTL
jgi:hypothetical protein